MEKHQWTDEEQNHLVTLMEELIADGEKADAGQFKPGSFQKIAEKMTEKFQTEFTVKHCKNKHKRLKEKYQSAADMLACSGFGWNEEKQTIEVDSRQVLETWAKAHPLRFYTPGKPFPLFRRLEAIFAKDRANGAVACDGGDASAYMEQWTDEAYTHEDYIPDLEGLQSDQNVREQDTIDSSTAKNIANNVASGKKVKESQELEVLQSLRDQVKYATDSHGDHVETLSKAMLGLHDKDSMGRTLRELGFGVDDIVVAGLKFSDNPNLAKTFWSMEDEQKPAFVRAVLHR